MNLDLSFINTLPFYVVLGIYLVSVAVKSINGYIQYWRLKEADWTKFFDGLYADLQKAIALIAVAVVVLLTNENAAILAFFYSLAAVLILRDIVSIAKLIGVTNEEVKHAHEMLTDKTINIDGRDIPMDFASNENRLGGVEQEHTTAPDGTPGAM